MDEQKHHDAWDKKWPIYVVGFLAICAGTISFYVDVQDKVEGIKSWLKK